MSNMSADSMIDRIRLKAQVIRWRSLAIILATALIAVAAAKSGGFIPSADYIARVSVKGIILEDQKRNEMLTRLKNDDHVKAVLVYINSPGGTMVGGETLYHSLRSVAEKKPVVAVMGSVAASGGYMTAIAADRVFAHAGTITGSIGVMLQTFEATELAGKLGLTFITFKSGELKGSPSPFEKLTQNVADAISASIRDSYEVFVSMVEERRQLPKDDVLKLSDGRIYTGRQAEKAKLIDALGGEEEAIAWLVQEKQINKSTPVKDVEVKEDKNLWGKLYSKITGGDTYVADIFGSGVMAMWNPSSL